MKHEALKAFLLFAILIAVFVATNMFTHNDFNVNIAEMTYRTELQPIVERFGKTIGIKSCYWKADVIGKSRLGPSSYWLKGFILLDEHTLQKIYNDYNLTSVSLEFDKGIEPGVTGFTDFEWAYNNELSQEIVGTSFLGKAWLDKNNGILYIDVQSN